MADEGVYLYLFEAFTLDCGPFEDTEKDSVILAHKERFDAKAISKMEQEFGSDLGKWVDAGFEFVEKAGRIEVYIHDETKYVSWEDRAQHFGFEGGKD